MSETERKRLPLDANSLQIIQYGGTVTDLAKMFRMDRSDLMRKISGVLPAGTRGSADVYLVHEIAPFLVKPRLDNLAEYIRTMPHSELPPQLTKEFWAGQKSRQDFEITAGTLWHQEEVIQRVGELFKLIKTSTQLAADTVERQIELTERQKKIIRGLMDGMMIELREVIIENFTEKALADGPAETEDDDI